MKNTIFSTFKVQTLILGLVVVCGNLSMAQTLKNVNKDVKEWTIPSGKLKFNLSSGTVDYNFNNGVTLDNTIGYVELLPSGLVKSTSFPKHTVKVEEVGPAKTKTTTVTFTHENNEGLVMTQVLSKKGRKQSFITFISK